MAELTFEKTTIKEEVSSEIASHDFVFKFKNTGKDIIKILDIQTSCGCTAAVGDKTEYRDGEEGAISGTFSTGDRKGLVSIKIIVKTDNLGQSQIPLNLQMTVKDPIGITPRLLVWKSSETTVEKKVTIASSDKNIQASAKLNGGDFAYKLNRLGNSKYEVVITPSTARAPKRNILEIQVTNSKGAVKSYPVYLTIK